jgi:hypothetical protein
MSSGPKPAPTTQNLAGGRLDPPAPLATLAQATTDRLKQVYTPGTANAPGPDTPSGDYTAMKPTWDKVEAIAGGVDKMRAAGEKYLPKFNLEDSDDYDDRKKVSPFVNKYEDVVSSLCSKPFTREVQYEDPDDVSEDYKQFYENVDGQGNNMHVFAEATFRAGVDNAIDWILVDFTKLPPLPEGRSARSVAEEQALGARPYWVHLPAPSVLAAYSDMVRGQEVLIHLRINEPTLVRDGYAEVVKTRVRQYDRQPFEAEDGQLDYAPATWALIEKNIEKNGKVTWDEIESGDVAIGIIPAVPFLTGKRGGNGWFVRAPLANLLDMQIDAFQQESNLRNCELLACFPMLSGNGVAAPQQGSAGAGQAGMPAGAAAPVKVRTGPRALLWAPPNPGGGPPGSWSFIEPAGTSLTYLKSRLADTYAAMDAIGMQPLSESPQTVITSANVSVKANSTLQALALRLKDALEQAMVVTAMWRGETKDDAPGVDVYTDFGVSLQGSAELTVLESAAKDGKLSGETFRAEMKRRNVLANNFSEAEEVARLASEAANAQPDPGMGSEGGIDPVTGKPLSPANDVGIDDDDAAEPVDPAKFKDASDIDDDTLAELFGEDVLQQVSGA